MAVLLIGYARVLPISRTSLLSVTASPRWV